MKQQLKNIIKFFSSKFGLKTYNDFLFAFITASSALTTGVIIFFAKEIRGTIGSYFALGLSEGLFLIALGISTLVWGVIIDYVQRRKLVLFISLEIAGIFVFLTSLTTNAAEYAVYRTLTGIFLAAVAPFLVSLVSDVHAAGERIVMFMALSMIGTLGTAVGYAFSLFLKDFVDWRTTLKIIATFQLVTSGVAFLIREPTRGETEKYIKKLRLTKKELVLRISKKDVIDVMRNKTNILLILQGFFGCLPWGAFSIFFVHAIAEKMQTDMLFVSLFIAISNASYLLAPRISRIFDSIRQKGQLDFLPISAGFLTLTYAALFQALININLPKINVTDIPSFFITLACLLVTSPEVLVFIIVSLIFPLISAQVGPIVNNIITDVNLPETRAFTRGLLTQIENIGKALGLIVCGLLIDKYNSFSRSLAIVSLSWFLSGIIWFFIVLTYRNDVEMIELRIIRKIHS